MRVVLLLVFSTLYLAAQTGAKQPVYFFLYSRFEDYIHPGPGEDRIHRFLRTLEQFRKNHPDVAISAVAQYSGAYAEFTADRNAKLGLTSRLQEAVRSGLVEPGYTAANEPSPAARPTPRFDKTANAEKLWAERVKAAELVLTAWKDPVTGKADPTRQGGLAKVEALLGPVQYVTGLTPALGADSEYLHVLRRMGRNPIVPGVPARDQERAIHGYGASVAMVARLASPTPSSSPELYWQDGFLHLSESFGPNRPMVGSDGPEVLAKLIDSLDRSRPHVLLVELAEYERYLNLNPDSKARYSPFKWAFEHPEQQQLPTGLSAWAQTPAVENGYDKEAALLEWIAREFIPKNPGSGFVSASRLRSVAGSPEGKSLSAAQVRDLATDLLERWPEMNMNPPDYAWANGSFYSLADAFAVFCMQLAGADARAGNVLGPLQLDYDTGPALTLKPDQVKRAAASLARSFASAPWSPRPAHMLPARVSVGNKEINSAQFLRAMAEAIKGEGEIEVTPRSLFSGPSEAYPRSVIIPYVVRPEHMGSMWTFRPAPIDSLLPVRAAR